MFKPYKIDMQFHSTLSDWGLSNQDIILLGKNSWMKYMVCTDHDTINYDFFTLAKANNIFSCLWVEISTRELLSNGVSKNIDILCYGNEMPHALEAILSNIRLGRVTRIKKLIVKIQELGVPIIEKDFYEDCFRMWAVESSINSYHLAQYIYRHSEWVAIISDLIGYELSMKEFLLQCLQPSGIYYHYFDIKYVDFRPTIQEIHQTLIWYDVLLSIAHPNFSFKTYDEFEAYLDQNMKYWINAIEINVFLQKDRVEKILTRSEKEGLVITVGSDCHFKWRNDKHWTLGELNPYVEVYMPRVIEILDQRLFK